MTHIDDTSEQILKMLFKPEMAAINVEALSRKLGVHRLTVSRRLDRLYEDGVLTAIQPRIEWGELGCDLITLMLMKLRITDVKARVGVAKRSPEVLAYGAVSSERDINRFEISAHSSLESYISSQEHRRGPNLSPHHTIVAHMPTKKMTHWPLLSLIQNAPGLHSRDSLTQKIITEIFSDDYVRINENAIGRDVGVNRLTVKRRIEKMRKTGLIRRIAPEINWHNLGLPLSVITLIHFDAGKVEKIMDYAASFGRVRWSGPCTTESTLNTFVLSLHPDFRSYVLWVNKVREKYEKWFGGHSIRAFLPSGMVRWNDPRKLLELSRKQGGD